MYMIATMHPIGLRMFADRDTAVRIADAWGFAPSRVHLNLKKG